MHLIVWEFSVPEPHRDAFERAYGPDGDWAVLFRTAPGYLGTELLKDDAAAGRYLTIDRWETSEDFARFKQMSGTAYEALDRQCEGLTTREARIGTFTPAGASRSTRPPDIIYKYVDQEGARKIIANRTLRFGRPSGMNDPFDIYIEDLFNVSLEEIHQRSIASLLDLLEQDPVRFGSYTGADPAEVRSVSRLIKSGSPEERAQLFAAITPTLLEEWDRDLAEMRNQMEIQHQGVIAQFQNTGVFCATRNRDNLLMWAHYAQQHRGVVLGFRPDLERDSFLAITKPVRYTNMRLTFYRPMEHTIANDVVFSENELVEFRNRLIYSKSSHWSYEEELRIDIPHGVPVGQSATFLQFYPSELCEMYLGCRVDEPFKSEIITAARGLNPDIAIFDARLAKESYALTFEPVG